MNALLIHNDNLPYNLIKEFQSSIRFNIPTSVVNSHNYSFDSYSDEFIVKHLSEQSYDVIFLTCSLSNKNYLDLAGIDLALHIRLTPKLKHSRVPIVFLSVETKEQVAKLMDDPTFLFTPGLFFLDKMDINSCLNFYQWISNEWKVKEPFLTDLEYTDFLKKISIDNPSHLDTSHSVTNEWSWIRYFDLLYIPENERQPKNKNYEVEVMYYSLLEESIKELKYQKTLHNKWLSLRWTRQYFTKPKHKYKPIVINNTGKKVGLVDDDFRKGWLCLYQYLLSDQKDGVEAFDGFDAELSRDQLVVKIVDWIKDVNSNKNIDLFIIDLRMHLDDLYELNVANLTGVQVIREIKDKINPGIQILVTTASDKVWTYKELQKSNVKNYVIKESPDKDSTREKSRLNFDILIRSLNDSIEMCYLAEIYRDLQDIKSRIKHKVEDRRKTYNDQKIYFYETLYSDGGLLDEIFRILNTGNSDLVNSALLLCYNIIEKYADNYSIFNDNWNVFDENGSPVLTYYPNGSHSDFEIVWGHFSDIMKDYSYQTKMEITSILFYPKSQQRRVDAGKENKIYPQYGSSILKMALVLKYKDNLDDKTINKLIKIRYIRNNFIAHIGSNIKKDVKIGIDEVLFLIRDIFMQIF